MEPKKEPRKEETPLAWSDDDPLLSMNDAHFARILREYPEATGKDFAAIAKMVKLLEQL